MSHVVVVLGAGASFDCAWGVGLNEHRRPPLTAQLFDESWADILRDYPLVQQASDRIRRETAEAGVGLETYLAQLRASSHEHEQRYFREIPLYLQHVLFQASRPQTVSAGTPGFTNHPNNYASLVSAALRLDEVIFITLNYDLLLDRRLAFEDYPNPREPMGIDWYVDPERRRRWALFKLHGSVNWGRRVLNESLPEAFTRSRADVFAELGSSLDLSDEITLKMHLAAELEDITSLRLDAENALYYPALAVPLGREDEHRQCPELHVNLLLGRLGELPSLNLLVIGYSGLDTMVAQLLARTGKELASMLVVEPDSERAAHAAQELAGALKGTALPEMVFDSGTGGDESVAAGARKGGFSEFVQSGALDRFIGRLSGIDS